MSETSQVVSLPTLEETSAKKYRGQYGPLDDDITVLRYKEKYPNTPIFNGAFRKVKYFCKEVPHKRYSLKER